MDDQKSDTRPELQPVTPSLRGAIRRARVEEAERSGVMAELRGAEIARLEMLAEALEPVFAQVPDHIDIFDAGVMPGDTPRLYIDMIGFVEMGPDKRTYRFIQNTRHGRVVAASSEKQDVMVDALATYIARRLVEREKALAGDRTIEEAARSYASAGPMQRQPARAAAVADHEAAAPAMMAAAPASAPPASAATRFATSAATNAAATPRPRRTFSRALLEGVIFLAELVGFIVLLIALFGALYFAWTLSEGWWQAYFNKTT